MRYQDRPAARCIGGHGFDYAANAPVEPAEIVLVTPQGHARVVAEDLLFPNGTVITPDGQTLIVAETFGNRLTAFDIESDGSLNNRRIWADLQGVFPDGICLDAEGAIWVAAPHPGEVMRVLKGGKISDRVAVSTRPYACMLGGDDRCTLFICTAGSAVPDEVLAGPGGKIETIDVKVPGAGLP